MFGSASDLEYAIKDAGGNTVVEYNGVRSYGILDYTDGLESLGEGGMVQTRVRTLLVISNKWALRQKGVISIISSNQQSANALVGVRLRIDHVAPQDDGAVSLLTIAGDP